MGWFDEQIRQRIESDQSNFEDSIFEMASSVIGKKAAKGITDSRIVTKAAIEEIIKYLGFKPKNEDFNELGEGVDLQNILRPYGVLYREVALDEEWLKEAYGPMLGRLDDGTVVALLPRPNGGYSYYDYQKNKKVIITAKEAEKIDPQAYCFYKPLPSKKLGIIDLLRFLFDCVDLSDVFFYGALTIFITIIELLIAMLVEFVTGFVAENSRINFLVSTAVFMLTLSFSSYFIKACSEMVLERIEIKTDINVEAAVMNRVLNLPASFFRQFTAGELSSRINSVSNLCNLLVENAVSVPIAFITSFTFLGQISTFSKELTLPAFVIVFSSLLFSIITILVQTEITRKVMKYDAHEDGITFAFINGIQKIRLSGAEKRAFAKWARDYNESASLLYNPPVLMKINKTITLAITLIGNIVLYFVAAKSGISVSNYMAFTTSFGFLTSAFGAISEVALDVANIRPICQLAEPILDAIPESNDGRTVINRLSGNIEVANVHFRYQENTPEVLKGVSFKVKAGEYVAVVGKTGCGKSTLLRILLGFEEPTKGSVFYDGKDITQIDLTSLRRKIGTVTQDGSLFQGDIYSNIVITNPELTLDDAWEAAEIAGIADDIRKMPMEMNTMISEGSGGISGGQRQRLMIARAVAPKPKILLLDEATSALDNITQKKVSDSLDKLKCTRIVIAHRLSTIRNCDRILVIDDGKIVEEGRYDELLSKNGFFTELVKRQQL
nr:ATP-binding cassette domain-containing protein [uncultured Butyrivibrio sp.]